MAIIIKMFDVEITHQDTHNVREVQANVSFKENFVLYLPWEWDKEEKLAESALMYFITEADMNPTLSFF